MASKKISQLELIKSLLHDTYLEKGNDAKNLIERDDLTGKIIMRRSIVADRIDYLLYRYDPNNIKLFPYFADISGLKKICDYILFAEEGQHLSLLLIELKLGTESARNQLIASECFAEFMIKSARRVGIELTENIYFRKIRVSEERAKNRNRLTKPGSLKYDENDIINYDYGDDFRIREVLEVL
ncbi:hypothetical protein VB796_08995 [Arcicella sp. LKC2W]|uniref:hypothetical protein n=1 Tax=Arcicella sp. LKC2W TaxID=2984198 RepID=UPI002B1EF88E|nr:hypothetical protein [Arcicella sp. LKC2W]MEA5459172.1 hypothetical protein [Arcicella sp. LKC2W]